MTILCEKCGSENHLEASECIDCGHPINKEIDYVICSVCGLSNPSSASKCAGCGEVLDANHSLNVEVEKTGEKKAKKTSRKKIDWHLVKWILIGILLFGLCVLGLTMILGDKVYIEAEEGFFYIDKTNTLYVIDDHNKSTLVATGIDSTDSVEKYGKNIYFLSEKVLYHYNGKLKEINDDINSYTISLDGKRVLYTREDDDPMLGDLYLYEGEKSTRIDGKVGIDRYTFGAYTKNIYYVTHITDEEGLGDLYVRSGDDTAEIIAEDVYEPVFSTKRNTVYFVRKDINEVEKFDLFYVNKDRVTEISRNLTHVFLEVDSENLVLIQEKDNMLSVINNKREDVDVIDIKFDRFGLNTFDDVAKGIHYLDRIDLLLENDDELYFFDGELKEMDISTEYMLLVDDKSTIFYYKEDEILKADYDEGSVANPASVATDATFLTHSESGALFTFEREGDIIYVNKGVEEVIETSSLIRFSDNEKYLLYQYLDDGFVFKIGASEPVFLGENLKDMWLLDDYVYTLDDDKLLRYKLGRFSSQKQIDTIKWISPLSIK